MAPYWQDDETGLALHVGDMREILPALNIAADLILADPPYNETSHDWDVWPDGWLDTAAAHTNSLWCFGSQRMFLRRAAEFASADWHLSQDVVGHDDEGQPVVDDVNVVWEKHNGSGIANDRFRRVHEHILHFYRGPWRDLHHDVPRVAYSGPNKSARGRDSRTPHTGAIGAHQYVDNGTRLMRSVIKAAAVRGKKRHPDEKPLPILTPLLQYACPPGGLVIDPFAGSGSTLDAARRLGIRAIGIERDEAHAEKAAERLAEPYAVDLFGEIPA